jgi:hypothetical protein
LVPPAAFGRAFFCARGVAAVAAVAVGAGAVLVGVALGLGLGVGLGVGLLVAVAVGVGVEVATVGEGLTEGLTVGDVATGDGVSRNTRDCAVGCVPGPAA